MILFWTGAAKVIGAAATRVIGKIAFGCVKYAPEILMGGRIALTVAGTVTACKATVTAQEILKKYEAEEQKLEHAVSAIREKQELYRKVQQNEPNKLAERLKERGEDKLPVIMAPSEYTDRDYKMEKLKLKWTLRKDMLKTYALSIGLFGLALVCDVLGYRTVSNRIAGLAMTVSSMQQIIKAQQAKIERLQSGQEQLPVIEGDGVVTDENGQVIPAQDNANKHVIEVEDDMFSNFKFEFGMGNPNWSKDPVLTRHFLERAQTELNELLALQTYVTLNDVGRALDKEWISRKYYGMFGWSNHNMDKSEILAGTLYRIDLGIDDPINKGKNEYILRPNIDGFIYHHIPDDEGLNAADQRRGLFSNLNGKINLGALARR